LRLVIADPDPLARRVIRDALSDHSDFQVVAEASDGVEAIELARHYLPDLLLTEVSLPLIDGLLVARKLLEDDLPIRVLFFATSEGEDLELRAVRAGGVGFVSKSLGVDAAVSAIEAVARGQAVISRDATLALVNQLRHQPDTGPGQRPPIKSNLTPREWEILDLLTKNQSTAEIAGALFLTPDTVYGHIKNIMRKLGVRSRSEAAVAAQSTLRDQAAPADEQPGSTEPSTADHEAIATAAAFELLREVEAKWPSEEPSPERTTMVTAPRPNQRPPQDLRELVKAQLDPIRSRTRETRRHGSRARDVVI